MDIQLTKTDYSLACKAVQNLLNGLEITGDCQAEDCKAIIEGVPSAADIVDAVWDAIK
jgi:hypothetical protein